MLSTISSIYDIPGLTAPFLLEGRKVLQEVVHEKKDWNDKVSECHRARWTKWRINLNLISTINIPRCIKPIGFGEIVSTTYHHFSDASEKGYGSAHYVRHVNESGEINVSLLMGKSRVSPMCPNTVPRLELTAGKVSAKEVNLATNK